MECQPRALNVAEHSLNLGFHHLPLILSSSMVPSQISGRYGKLLLRWCRADVRESNWKYMFFCLVSSEDSKILITVHQMELYELTTFHLHAFFSAACMLLFHVFFLVSGRAMCEFWGDHSYHAVKQDLQLWRDKLRPGGLLAGGFHPRLMALRKIDISVLWWH